MQGPVPGCDNASPAAAAFVLIDKNDPVVLPFRNEATHLADTIRRILETLRDNDELLLIDDNSEDSSLLIAQSNADHRTQILSSEKSGKKAALTLGIEYASNEVIITVDADIRPQSHWPALMIQPFTNPEIQMVCGAVHTIVNKRKRSSTYEAVDVLSLVGSARALVSQNWAVMCNGANLAFRKSAFQAVGGYVENENHSSGDDVFLLHAIMKAYPNGVIPCPEYAYGGVLTHAESGWMDLIVQRIRWAGKSKGYKDPKAIFTTYFIGAMNLAVPFLFLLWIVFPELAPYVLIYWIGKALFDTALVQTYNSKYKRKLPLLAIFLQSFLYPWYLTLIALLTPFIHVRWKGRHLDSRFESDSKTSRPDTD